MKVHANTHLEVMRRQPVNARPGWRSRSRPLDDRPFAEFWTAPPKFEQVLAIEARSVTQMSLRRDPASKPSQLASENEMCRVVKPAGELPHGA
jgi:hypothetical protein